MLTIRKTIIYFCRNPDVYTVLASEDVSEGEDNDGDCIGEMLDSHKKSVIETQSIEKHDVWQFVINC